MKHSMEGCALLPRLRVLLRRHVDHTRRLACARALQEVMWQLQYGRAFIDSLYLAQKASFEVKGPPR